MASLPVRQNHYARASLADHARNFQAIFPGIFDAAIGNIECAAPPYAKNRRCIRGFLRPILSCAAGTHFTLRQIEDAGALAALRGFQQRPAAGLLYVITVRGDGQDVESRYGHVSRDLRAPAEQVLLLL